MLLPRAPLASFDTSGTPAAGAAAGSGHGLRARSGIAGVTESGGSEPDSDALLPFGGGNDSTLLVVIVALLAVGLLVRRELSHR